VKDLYRSKAFLRCRSHGDRHQPGTRYSLSSRLRRNLGHDLVVGARHADRATFRDLDPERGARCADFRRRRLRPEHAIGDRLSIGEDRQGEGTIGQVWTTGIPAVRDSIAADASPAAGPAVAAGLDAMVAMPIMNDRGLKAVVAWYF